MQQAIDNLKEYIKNFDPIELLSYYSFNRVIQYNFPNPNLNSVQKVQNTSPQNLEILHYIILTINYKENKQPYSNIQTINLNTLYQLLYEIKELQYHPFLQSYSKKKIFDIIMKIDTSLNINPKSVVHTIKQNTLILQEIDTRETRQQLHFQISLLVNFISQPREIIEYRTNMLLNSKEIKGGKFICDSMETKNIFIFHINDFEKIVKNKTSLELILNLLSYELGDLKKVEYSEENKRKVIFKPFIKISHTQYLVPNVHVLQYGFEDIIANMLKPYCKLANQYARSRGKYLEDHTKEILTQYFGNGKIKDKILFQINQQSGETDFDIKIYNKRMIIEAKAHKLNENHKQGKYLQSYFAKVFVKSGQQIVKYEQKLQQNNEFALDTLKLTMLLELLPQYMLNQVNIQENFNDYKDPINSSIVLSHFEMICDVLEYDVIILDFLIHTLFKNRDLSHTINLLELYFIDQQCINLDDKQKKLYKENFYNEKGLSQIQEYYENLELENNIQKPHLNYSNRFIKFIQQIYNQEGFYGITSLLISYNTHDFNILYKALLSTVQICKRNSSSCHLINHTLHSVFLYYKNKDEIKREIKKLGTNLNIEKYNIILYNYDKNIIDQYIINIVKINEIYTLIDENTTILYMTSDTI